MKKYVVIDNSCGAEIGEPFEADNREEALTNVLEQQGYRVVEVEEE